MRHKGILLWAALFLVLQPAHGALVSYSFRGTVSEVMDFGFQLDQSVTNGTPFQGYYLFDDSTPDTNPDPTVGDYYHRSGQAGIVVKMGSYVFRTHPDHVEFLVEIVNRAPDNQSGAGDNYLLRSYHNISSTGLPVDHIAWQLDDRSGVAYDSADLPSGPPTLSSFESMFGLTVTGSECDGFFVRGHVSSIEKTPPVIPTPPSIAIAEAVELAFPSALGYFYQVQYSHDLETWTNVGEKMLGTGDVLKTFVRKSASSLTYYRAEIANTP